jgi:hypothetical protein
MDYIVLSDITDGTGAGVSCHHPYRRFAQVINASSRRVIQARPQGFAEVRAAGLQLAELAGAGHRRGAVLGAEFAVQGALVGFHGVQ